MDAETMPTLIAYNHATCMDIGKAIYLIGRSHRRTPYDTQEREAITRFIRDIAVDRPDLMALIRLDNTAGGWDAQSDECLGRNLQRIGRAIRKTAVDADARELCETLIASVGQHRAVQGGYSAAGKLQVGMQISETGKIQVDISTT